MAWLLVAAALASAPVAAQEPLTANDFRIDALATPVVQGGSRAVGLAGAYTALAEGIDGVPYNPAGYAARFPYEHDWYEYELSLGVQTAGAFSDVDYFLHDESDELGDVSGFWGANAALRLQFGQLGIGGSIQLEVFDVRETDPIDVNFLTLRGGIGYNLWDGQLAIGGGATIVQMTIDEGAVPLVDFTGIGVEGGAVLRPSDRRWRVGAMLRSPIDARVVAEEGDPAMPTQVAGFILPQAVNLPWEVRAGFAWQFLERPFNPRFAPPKNVERAIEARLARRRCERERAQVLREAGDAAVAIGQCPRLARHARDPQWWEAERALRAEENREAQRQIEHGRDVLDAFWDSMEASRARRYVLISADLRVLGAVEDGVGIDAFIEQERRTRGDGIDVGFHLGAESEIIANWLKIRGGVYLEPARYSGARDRFHGTVGFDVRVVELLGTTLRAGFYVDGARNWVNWGLSVGAWH